MPSKLFVSCFSQPQQTQNTASTAFAPARLGNERKIHVNLCFTGMHSSKMTSPPPGGPHSPRDQRLGKGQKPLKRLRIWMQPGPCWFQLGLCQRVFMMHCVALWSCFLSHARSSWGINSTVFVCNIWYKLLRSPEGLARSINMASKYNERPY